MSTEQLGVPADDAPRPKSKLVSDEQIHASACGSAIEINYDEESRPTVIPFFAEWTFGSRPGCRVLNLSVDGRGLLAYSTAHVVVLYDYKAHSQRLLLGHKNTVASMSVDSTATWLVSVDAGSEKTEQSTVLVWKLSASSLHRTLPATPPPEGYRVVAMSPDAQFVAAVTAGPRRVAFLWRWLDGVANQPDATLELPDALGEANALTFNPDDTSLLMVTCDRNVAFMVWVNGALQLYVGQLITMCPGTLVDSVYLRGTSNAISVSTKGFVIVWGDPPIYTPYVKMSRQVYCIEKDGLASLSEVDGMVVVGTRAGHVRFYDQDMCLLYWHQQADLDAVTSLSFNLDQPDGSDLSWAGSRTSFPTVRHSVDAEQKAVHERLSLSRLISGPSPRQLDAEDPFQARDLVLSTASGRLVLVSFANQRCVVLQDRLDTITVVQAHPEKPILLIGRANGSISMIDYAKKEVMVTYTFEGRPGIDPPAVTSLKYSPNGVVLACGRANGALHLLHPVLLEPVASPPFHKTSRAIHHLCFSPDNMYMAHSDSANSVSVYRCQNVTKGRWVYLGKKTLHSLPVKNLLFGPKPFEATLFSLGEDLILVEYDVANSLNNMLLVKRMDRVDQSGQPSCITWCPGELDNEELALLVATTEYKYKLVDLKARRLCAVRQGPRLRTPVSIIKTIGGASAKAPATAVYTTQRQLGLQCLPPDGNPFRNVGMIAHPVKIMNFVISACEEYVFTCGVQDHTVIMWRVNPEAAEAIHAEDNERSLAPWLLSVEGGREGWLLEAMQDLFCYAQLLHQGTFSTEPRCITDRLPVCELPDVMRALGFYPSQFEIDTMVQEVVRRHGETLTSSDLVRLYVNHKPVHGVSLGQLREAFGVFAYPMGQDGELAMTKEKFLSIVLDKGEALDLDEAQGVLRLLLLDAVEASADESEATYSHLVMDEATRREQLFHFLPDPITFTYFVEDILGVLKK